MAYGIWSIAFRKKYFFLPEADSMYGLQQPEFVLGKKKISYPEQFLCMA